MRYRLHIVFLMVSIMFIFVLPVQAQTASEQWDEIGNHLASTAQNFCSIGSDLCQTARTVALWTTWAASGSTGFFARHPKKIVAASAVAGFCAWYYWNTLKDYYAKASDCLRSKMWSQKDDTLQTDG